MSREIAPYVFWLLSAISGLIGLGAIAAHLADTYGYLFAFTLGGILSAIGAQLIAILTYLTCLVIAYVYESLIELMAWIRASKTRR